MRTLLYLRKTALLFVECLLYDIVRTFIVMSECVGYYFFFSSRRRHTRFDCDWSSDVCSSDLSVMESISRSSCLSAILSARCEATVSASFEGSSIWLIDTSTSGGTLRLSLTY